MLMTTLSPFEPPRTRVSQRERKGSRVKAALLFLLKCLVFAVVFWSVWIFAMRPLADGISVDSERLLVRQEALLNRLEAVVQRWESQENAKK